MKTKKNCDTVSLSYTSAARILRGRCGVHNRAADLERFTAAPPYGGSEEAQEFVHTRELSSDRIQRYVGPTG